jgi:hypothetical protein
MSDLSILAAPRATADQCIRFLLARPHGEYTDYDITNVIVPAYFRVACERHGDYAGGACAECAAEQQPTDDTLARFSTHHALWRGARHDIEQL